MIRLTRGPEPKALTKNKVRWLAALNAAITPESRKRAESKYGHQMIKAALVEMCHGKCAYCESKLLHIDYGDIEHFRPKGTVEYRNLTFEWSNLLLACRVCNGAEHKGKKFPLSEGVGLLIDPSAELPHEHLHFVYDAIAEVASVTCKTLRGQVSRDLLGLNRPALREQRSIFMKKLALVATLAPNDQSARDLIDEAALDTSEFSAFAKTLRSQISHI